MNTTTAPKTFRARSLTDALAQVRDELGPDAVVVRRREGLEGGVAGFFQRAVVEIEAQPGGAALLTVGAPGTPLLDDDGPVVPEPMPAPAQIAPALARDASGLRHARPAFVVAAVLAQAVSLGCYALLYRRVLASLGARVPFLLAARVTLASFLVSHLTRSGRPGAR